MTSIITFYSRNGSASCTTSVANVGWILASAGKKVLVVDWNLDDPALHRFFTPFAAGDQALPDVEGIVDMQRGLIVDLEEPGDTPESELLARHADVRPRTTSLGWSDFPGVPAGPLDLLGPGRQDSHYLDRVARVTRYELDNQSRTRDFAVAMRQSMEDAGYDYVLIDSHNGLPAEQQVSATVLADTVVVSFPMNSRAVLRAARAARGIRDISGDVRIVPVPTKVDLAAERVDEIRDRLRFDFAGLVDDDAAADPTYWNRIEIPYVARYTNDEILAAIAERPGSPNGLLAAYERLTALLTRNEVTALRPLPEAARILIQVQVTQQGRARVDAVALVADGCDRAWADWVKTQLQWAGIRVTEPPAPAPDGDLDVSPETTVVVLLTPNLHDSPKAEAVVRLHLDRDDGEHGAEVVGVLVAEGPLPEPLLDTMHIDLSVRDEDDARNELLAYFKRQHVAFTQGGRPARGPRFPARRPKFWNVPARNAEFTGRAELLDELRNVLGTSMDDRQPVALVGLSGSGKTEVAREYAHRFQADYDLVWWLSGEAWSVRNQLAALAQRLGHPMEDGVFDVRAFFDWLRETPANRLFIYDDADAPGNLVGFIPDNGIAHVIVTSFNQDWAIEHRSFDVGPFQEEESLRLLRKHASDVPPELAQDVAKALGHLPIALNQAGEWLVTHNYLGSGAAPAEEYLRRLRRQAKSIKGKSDPTSAGARLATALSLDDLERSRPAAFRLLNLCAFLAPDGIAMDLLSSPAMQADLKDRDGELKDEDIQFGEVVHRLTRYSLARHDVRAGKLRLNTLIQMLVQDRMTDGMRRECQRAIQGILAAQAPSDVEMDLPKHDETYAELGRHLYPSDALESTDQRVRRWLVNQVRYHYRKGHHRFAVKIGRRLYVAWTGEDSPNDRLCLRLGTQLSNAIRSEGDYLAAHELAAPILEAQKKLLGPEHWITLMTQSGHSADLRALGQFSEAFDLDQQTYKGYAKALGDDHGLTLLAGHNLAISLSVCGRWREALDKALEVFVAREQIFAEDERTWVAGCAVGAYYRLCGEYDVSRRRLADCHGRLQAMAGDDAASVHYAATELAATMRYLQQPEAMTEAKRGWNGRRERHGDSNAATVIAANELAACEAAFSGPADALGRSREVHQHAREAYGEDHPFVDIVGANRAAYAAACGEHDEARREGEHAWSRLNDHTDVGPDHPFTLIAAISYANALVAPGDDADNDEIALALDLDNQARSGFHRRFGEGHPYTGLALRNANDTHARASGTTSTLADPGGRRHIDGEIPAI